MRKELKKYIQDSYDVPSPQRKKEFLQNLNYPKTRWKDFLLCQLSYIQKRVWVVSVLLLMAVMVMELHMQQGDVRLLWFVSAVIPFIAVTTVTEIAHSTTCGMAELEMTTRYNLRSVILARLGILGVGNLTLLLVIMPVLTLKLNMGIIKLGVYLLVPYLLTCFLSLNLVNRIRTSDAPYYCAIVAVAISGIGLVFGSVKSVIYQQQFFKLWLIMLAFLAMAIGRSISKTMKDMEELTWNSYSIV